MNIGPLIDRDMLCVGPQQTLVEGAQRMRERKVGSAVVLTEDGSPGIITERDLLRAIADGVDLATTSIESYMTADVITASPSWGCEEAAARMLEGGFRHLVVLGEDGSPSGIVSIRDLLKAVLESGSRDAPHKELA